MYFKYISNLNNYKKTLGDLKLAYEWYDLSTKLDDKFRKAFLKKHAVMCHIKLEGYLEDQHMYYLFLYFLHNDYEIFKKFKEKIK